MKYVQGKYQNTADALSRAPSGGPTPADSVFVQEVEAFKEYTMLHLPATDQRLQEVKTAQQKDAICTQVIAYCKEGWPPIMPSQPLLRPYWENKHHLTMHDDILMYDNRLVIPQMLQLEMLDKLHTGHLGITKCKGRAQNSVWWPSVTAQVEAMCNKCVTCTRFRSERKEPLIPLSTPDGGPWDRVGTDLFEFEKKHYMVIVDYTSRWIDFKELQSTSSQAVIRVLCEIFATHGIPSVVVSDNGPQYASQEFKEFAKDWGFTHVTSSPLYPQANGEAERAVQTAKNILRKNANPYLGLLAYRSAPIHNGKTPSQILMSRMLKTTLPSVRENLEPSVVNKEQFRDSEEKYRQKFAENYDKRHKVVALPALNPGDKVFIRDSGRHGEIQERLNSPRSYKVSTDNGATYRRNRSALIHTGMNTPPTSESEQSSHSSPSPTRVSSPMKASVTPPSPQPGSPVRVADSPTVTVPTSVRKSSRMSKPAKQPDMVYY